MTPYRHPARDRCAVHAHDDATVACVQCRRLACDRCAPAPSSICRPCLVALGAELDPDDATWWRPSRAASLRAVQWGIPATAVAVASAAVDAPTATMLALASIACAVTLFPHVRTARRNRDAAAFWAGVAALGTDDPADGVARLERLARAHGTTYEARRAALSHLSIAMLTLGLHRRARPLVASLEHAELSRHTLEHYKQASMLIHVALGDLESARAARARLTERVPPYHDALFAAREGRWEDAVTMARVSYDEARAYHDDPSVLRWPAAILAFALARSGRKGKELRASLRAARGAPHPMAVAIPEWPELREFVEHHVDRPGAGSTP